MASLSMCKAGARQLLDKIKKHQDVLHWNDKGELLYENKPIPGSDVDDLVNDTLRHRKGFERVEWLVGWLVVSRFGYQIN